MRVMALDIGEVRVGIAVSDAQGSIASPVCVLPAAEVESNAASFRRVLEDWDPDLLLCGLPYTLSGEEGPQAQRIRGIACRIASRIGLPLEYADERLTSREAKQVLHEQGLAEKQMRGKVDMVAASLMLQAWLDARRAEQREERL